MSSKKVFYDSDDSEDAVTTIRFKRCVEDDDDDDDDGDDSDSSSDSSDSSDSDASSNSDSSSDSSDSSDSSSHTVNHFLFENEPELEGSIKKHKGEKIEKPTPEDKAFIDLDSTHCKDVHDEVDEKEKNAAYIEDSIAVDEFMEALEESKTREVIKERRRNARPKITHISQLTFGNCFYQTLKQQNRKKQIVKTASKIDSRLLARRMGLSLKRKRSIIPTIPQQRTVFRCTKCHEYPRVKSQFWCTDCIDERTTKNRFLRLKKKS